MWELFKIQIVTIVLGIFFSVLWSKFYPKQLFLSRKFLHILVISLCANIIYFLPTAFVQNVTIIVAISCVVLFFLVFKGFFKTDNRKSWGIFYFPLGFLFQLIVFPDELKLIAIVFYILAFSDGFSAVIGRLSQNMVSSRFRKINEVKWSSDTKTISGSLVFAISTVVILWIFLSSSPASNIKNLFTVICFISIFLTGIELFASKGSDNLFIPIVGFLLLHNIDLIFSVLENNSAFSILILVSGIIAIRKFNWLSNSGIFQAILLLTSMVFANFTLVPIMIFFILGSIASKLNKGQVSDSKHGKARDGYQVLANGGIVLLLAWLKIETGLKVFDILMLISVSVSIADTFSSEFGMKFGGQPFDILKLKRVSAGLSGGVSFIGTMASIFGAGIISIYYNLMYHNYKISLLILMAGIFGSLLDSVLGSLLQPKYKSVKGEILDYGNISEKISGVSYFSNDFVNFLSNLFITSIFYVILVYLV